MTSRHFATFALVLLTASTLLAAVPQPVTIPAGTEIHFKLLRAINTANAKPGQNVPGALTPGALAGQALGGNRDATAKGAAIGAGVGIGAAAATGKFDFTVPAGERFELSLKSSVSASL